MYGKGRVSPVAWCSAEGSPVGSYDWNVLIKFDGALGKSIVLCFFAMIFVAIGAADVKVPSAHHPSQSTIAIGIPRST